MIWQTSSPPSWMQRPSSGTAEDRNDDVAPDQALPK
jgi:hypothetical protein